MAKHIMQLTSPPRGEWPTDLGYETGRIALWSPRALCRCKRWESDDCASSDEAAREHERHLQAVAR